MSEVAQRVAETADLVTVALDELLPRADGPESRLTEAMRYAVLGPGRRLRPFFTLETGRMFGVDERPLLRAACALECIHVYRLIHDDLPCLDDDDLRRGRPTVHKAYDEATAVLAGDALQSAAFEILSHPDTHKDGAIRAELVQKLAQASGARGTQMGQFAQLKREIVPPGTIPKSMGDGLVAMEDHTFRENSGVDLKVMARALLNDVTCGSQQGASTLTQQYVKNYLIGRTTTNYVGKLREAMLALKISKTVSKDDILDRYLNTI